MHNSNWCEMLPNWVKIQNEFLLWILGNAWLFSLTTSVVKIRWPYLVPPVVAMTVYSHKSKIYTDLNITPEWSCSSQCRAQSFLKLTNIGKKFQSFTARSMINHVTKRQQTQSIKQTEDGITRLVDRKDDGSSFSAQSTRTWQDNYHTKKISFSGGSRISPMGRQLCGRDT